MNWSALITDLRTQAKLSQAAIGKALGKSQGWVCAVEGGQYDDLKWRDGEALRALHRAQVGAGETAANPITPAPGDASAIGARPDGAEQREAA